MDLYEIVTRVAADPELASAHGFDVDVQKEIVRLESHSDYEHDSDELEELMEGESFYPALDAENAPFTGTQHVMFWLMGEFKGWSALVLDDGTLDIDDATPAAAAAAMQEAYGEIREQLSELSEQL